MNHHSGDVAADPGEIDKALHDLALNYTALRLSDPDGDEAFQEDAAEREHDKLLAALGISAADARARYGLSIGVMPANLGAVWDDGSHWAEDRPSDQMLPASVEDAIGELLSIALHFDATAPEAGNSIIHLEQLDETVLRPGLAWISDAIAQNAEASGRLALLVLIASTLVCGGVALGSVFLVFRPMAGAMLRDRQQIVVERDRAIASDRAKRDFLAVMSHELRTPMNGVLGFANLLLHGPLDPEQRDHAETIVASGEQLLELLNDLLDVSKIEAGSFELEPANMSLPGVIDGVIKLMGPRAREKHLELSSYIDPALPSSLYADVGAVRKILLNLVGNAIKFTPTGAIAVEVTCEGTAEDGNTEVHLAVTDTGVGIPADRLDTIFDRFTQVDASSNREFEGSGLGLAICKDLAQLMNGHVAVDSTPDQGSTFHVHLCLPPARPPADAVATTIGDALAGRRLLVVDDNALNRRIFRLQFEGAGAEPVVVGSARNALDELARAERAGRPFDVLITDQMMPEIDGVALLKLVRAQPGGTSIPAVLSSSAGVSSDQEAQALGFDAAVPKPVVQNVLLAAVARVLHAPASASLDCTASTSDTAAGSVPPRSAAARPAVPQPDAPAAAGTRSGRILLVEDNASNQKLVKTLLTKAGYTVDVAGNGLEAIAAVSRLPYNLILMDVRMPGMDGLEATRRIRTMTSAPPDLPIVAMTANAMAHDKDAIFAAGMDGCLTKPVDIYALMSTIETHLDPKREPSGDGGKRAADG